MATVPEKLSDTVTKLAQSPLEVQVAGMGFSKEQNLDHVIKAAKFMPSASVAKRVGAGIRFTKASAGGAV